MQNSTQTIIINGGALKLTSTEVRIFNSERQNKGNQRLVYLKVWEWK